MKITFSFNQVCQIQLAAERRAEFRDLMRSYLGIKPGCKFDNTDMLELILGDTFNKFIKDSSLVIQVRGVIFDLAVVENAIRVDMAIVDIQLASNAFAIGATKPFLSVSKAVKKAKSLIDDVEW